MARKKKNAEETPSEGGEETADKKKKGKGPMLPAIIIAVGLLGGGYFMGGKSSASSAAPAGQATTSTTEKAKEPGAVKALDAITLNLADGRFLKVGVALQLAKDDAAPAAGHGGAASTEENPKATYAKALNETISYLGSFTYSQLSAPGARDAARTELTKRIGKAYEGKVLDVYFTDFVMQ